MKYNSFIPQSPAVSEIGFGAWQLGVNSGWKSIPEEEAIKMVHYALDHEVNFFDTAPNYGLGSSEDRLGKALKVVDRDRIVINTKFGHGVDGVRNYSSAQIRNSLEGSLKRLQIEYVDSLILHNPPFEFLDGDATDHYDILERLKEEGKIKAYGASIDTYEELQLLMDTTSSQVAEVFYNILHQGAAKAFEQAKDQGMGLIVKVPLDSGWLSGKYSAESTFTDIRSRWSEKDKRTRAKLVKRVQDILDAHSANLPLTQAALSFCRANNAVSTVIPGNTTLEQVQSNIQSSETHLSQQLIKELEEFYLNEVETMNLPW